ncbi:MAG TPA: hypothetical protein VIW29_15120 [Polyangiaceae bacterium]
MRLRVPQPLFGLLLLASACNGADAASPEEPQATTTHALLRVERSAMVGAEGEAIGKAFAGVVRVLETSDPEPLLRLSGNGLALPAVGQCATANREREALPTTDMGRAEFLALGEVHLAASDSETLLAPRAFPSPQADVSGVVYTSRDQASEPLPGAAGYVLKTTGSEQLPPLELRVQAPELLTNVALGGLALEQIDAVSTATQLEVSWRAGDGRDLVYVEVAGADVGTLGACSFRDSDGHGRLPQGLFGALGAGRLTFHRLREVAAEVRALDAAEVRFDFELTTALTFR